jgi:hypothetical protein
MKTGHFTNERTVMELMEEYGDFKKWEPLVVESLVTGSITKSTSIFFNFEDEVRIELTKEDTKELVNLLSRTKAKRTIETLRDEGETFNIRLNNTGYTMPYQLDVALTLQLNEEENAMIFVPRYAEGYITEDLTIYKKINELIEKYSVK